MRYSDDHVESPLHLLLNSFNKTATKGHVRSLQDYLDFKNATPNNVKGFSVRFPKNTLTVVTGVAGSSKSSLVHPIYLIQASSSHVSYIF